MGVTLISLRQLAVEQELNHCSRMLLQDRCPADVLTQMLRQDCDVTKSTPEETAQNSTGNDKSVPRLRVLVRCETGAWPVNSHERLQSSAFFDGVCSAHSEVVRSRAHLCVR